jgi:hypothetical protein
MGLANPNGQGKHILSDVIPNMRLTESIEIYHKTKYGKK